MIPNILHFIWIGKNVPAYATYAINMFKKVNPDFKINFIQEESVFTSSHPDIIDCLKLIHESNNIYYELFNSIHFKNYQYTDDTVFNTAFSDVLRFYILKKYGGIYLDCDTFPLKPFDSNLLAKKYFQCFIKRPKCDIRPDNYFIGCEPGIDLCYRPYIYDTLKIKPERLCIDEYTTQVDLIKKLQKKFFDCTLKYGEGFHKSSLNYINHYSYNKDNWYTKIQNIKFKSGTFKLNFNGKFIIEELKNDILNFNNSLYLPNGGNLGDAVIAFSEYQTFDNLKLNYQQITNNNYKSIFNKPFSLIYGGGGIWTGLYNTSKITDIFKNKNLQKCLILPSTFYNCDNIIQLFDERFTVYCRDQKSYEYCKKLNNKATFKLHDDIVFCADFSNLNIQSMTNIKTKPAIDSTKKIHQYRLKNDHGTANFMRSDKERISIQKDSFDISSTLIINGFNITKQIVEEATRIILYTINKYDTIITNRLHVAICSYKLNKKIELHNNSYGKVFNVFRYSIPDYDKVNYLDKNIQYKSGISYNSLFKNTFIISSNQEHEKIIRSQLLDIGIQPQHWQAARFHIDNRAISSKDYKIIGCSTSHLSIIKLAEYNNYDAVCIFEDDANINLQNFKLLNSLTDILNKIPEKCDVLSLGYLLCEGELNPDGIKKVTKMYGSHAYIIFKQAYQKYQEYFYTKTHTADLILSKMNTYAVMPCLFNQTVYPDRIHVDKYH